ncbi:ATP-binding protein [Aeromicrobium sp. Leaf350]|uniref:ATP-binding protein n=1 Tax=Aeromicrobium sp. Leaf350 TaxID=2876565 RepID=UPI001E638138|nr:ATP-binding protein [Aeromicrobium sp. Leaf350]
MTSPSARPAPPVRRAYRPAGRRLVSGVSAGVADHLGVDTLWVRLAFTVTAVLNGVGIVAYLLLWRFLPIADDTASPGLEAAGRRGLRTARTTTWVDHTRAVAILALGAGVALALQVSGQGIAWGWLVPLTVGGAGLAVMWRGLDDVGRVSRLRWWSVARVVVGIGLVAAAAAFAVTVEGGWSALADAGVAIAVALVGLAIVAGPWIASLVTDLGAERRERVRSQERADVAAHLHDSVLQTLSLLQKYADDPATVSTVARRQERELRAWLYGGDELADSTLAVAMRAAADEVEDHHRVAVELVVVGDTPVDPDVVAVVRAAREAMVNAAKHAGVDRVDVFAEASPGVVEVFVRDRGAGFDPESVDPDRMGLRGSIMDRVRRHGGRAEVRSSPGSGTEVRLVLPRPERPSHDEPKRDEPKHQEHNPGTTDPRSEHDRV